MTCTTISSVIGRTLFALFSVGIGLPSSGVDVSSSIPAHFADASMTTIDEPGGEPSIQVSSKETAVPVASAEDGAPGWGEYLFLPELEGAPPRSLRRGVRFGRAPPLVLSPA